VIVHDRPVLFEDVDAAGIVFFARFLGYCHEAMERLFDGVEGGYKGLILDRRIGFPAVHVTTDFSSPLRYGDVARVEALVTKLGQTACHLHFTITRAKDGALVATMSHVAVCSDLTTLTKLALPPDVRTALETHLGAPAA
jgi:4-hydroxybenzoyl-CoA thioesterase